MSSTTLLRLSRELILSSSRFPVKHFFLTSSRLLQCRSRFSEISPHGRGKLSYQMPPPLSSTFLDFVAGIWLGSASTAGAPPPRACVIYQQPQRLSRALRDLFEDSPIRPAHASLRAENRSARQGGFKGSRPWSALLYDANSGRDVHFCLRGIPRGPPQA